MWSMSGSQIPVIVPLERCMCCGGEHLVELDDEITCLTCLATIPVANVVRWEHVADVRDGR